MILCKVTNTFESKYVVVQCNSIPIQWNPHNCKGLKKFSILSIKIPLPWIEKQGDNMNDYSK